MEFLAQYGLFLAKTITLVIAILFIAGALISLILKNRDRNGAHLSLKKLNDKYDDLRDDLRHEMLSKKEYKKWAKTEKKRLKAEENQTRLRAYTICFEGDVKATNVSNLREEITAVLAIATPQDEVVVTLESGGGMVHAYGLAASQLQRIRDRNIPLTVIVDKIAASGGYMMACVANKLISAPFAIIGSVGVIMELPNFHRLLKKNDIDYEMLTAGEYKRTLTMFGENTAEGRAKVQQELEEAHVLFKEFIIQYRPQVDIAQIATGEYWFGTKAKELNLVDATQTSDDYLLALSEKADVYKLKYHSKKPLGQRLSLSFQNALQSLKSFI